MPSELSIPKEKARIGVGVKLLFLSIVVLSDYFFWVNGGEHLPDLHWDIFKPKCCLIHLFTFQW
jgi:hypothetical protein